jgi:hypothetical protein
MLVDIIPDDSKSNNQISEQLFQAVEAGNFSQIVAKKGASVNAREFFKFEYTSRAVI